MNARVCAVVVTYNRKVLLRQCLLALESQTRRPEAILVVDNCSTDGTDAMLSEEFGHLSHLRLPVNTGGAGGFHDGMKWAYQQGFEWIWVMDDDVEAVPEALATLLEFQTLSEFIHPRRVNDKGEPVPWEGVLDPTSGGKKAFGTDISFENGRAWISVNYGCFEGALIHRRIVELIGFPDKRFFIQGDDTIYGYQAALYTNVIYINKVGLRRKLPVSPEMTERKCYILFRNRFLTYEHFASSVLPMSRIAFWLQNLLLVTWYIRTTNPRHPLNYWHNLRGMLSGMWDGTRGRYGAPPWVR
jgi:rhamnopyranosyl-N-acetylglucosaminyl-diphospho-decaprenol beta-1,3/1,4-galactofuranosyltransferase